MCDVYHRTEERQCAAMNGESQQNAQSRAPAQNILRDPRLVTDFLHKHSVLISAPSRMLDLVSEFAELADELRSVQASEAQTVSATLIEELGDFYFSLVAFCIENNSYPSEFVSSLNTPLELHGAIEAGLGKLAKQVLRATKYGQVPDGRPEKEAVVPLLSTLLADTTQLASLCRVELTSALQAVIQKYEARFARTTSMDSGK